MIGRNELCVCVFVCVLGLFLPSPSEPGTFYQLRKY